MGCPGPFEVFNVGVLECIQNVIEFFDDRILLRQPRPMLLKASIIIIQRCPCLSWPAWRHSNLISMIGLMARVLVIGLASWGPLVTSLLVFETLRGCLLGFANVTIGLTSCIKGLLNRGGTSDFSGDGIGLPMILSELTSPGH